MEPEDHVTETVTTCKEHPAMRNDAAAANPAIRIGAVIVGGFVALLVLGAVIRPDMMTGGMTMLHNLIVGFGL